MTVERRENTKRVRQVDTGIVGIKYRGVQSRDRVQRQNPFWGDLGYKFSLKSWQTEGGLNEY